ncbi:tRNA-binding protein [Kushneria marisflavi]|uniref:tRNA-binding protein n=1 Tax=Kushneria marisflavi TaxID=157779 RepID=A0A240UNL2_9GAMM|nr:tRNA-binding protein [Kushneria marisflavi]ART63097.1 tRNA-binding protein [Kushneria marisflavi]RKD84651.1 tRNA-binding protein [Kushneria marisflavi]
MSTLSWEEFSKVELRVGRITHAEVFEKARRLAYVLQVDFGPEIGMRKSSAQITELYDPATLVGRLVVAVTNFPPKQIGPIMSECLVTGFHNEDGAVALCVPDQDVPLGTRLM